MLRRTQTFRKFSAIAPLCHKSVITGRARPRNLPGAFLIPPVLPVVADFPFVQGQRKEALADSLFKHSDEHHNQAYMYVKIHPKWLKIHGVVCF